MYWQARKAWLLSVAQEHVFRDEDLQALATLEQVRALDPENEIARQWEQKAREKLGERYATRGDEALFGGDLEAALLAYNEALRFVPRHPGAVDGLQKVDAEWRRRRSVAQERYLEGVRALAEQLFAQTEYHMFIALDNDPSFERAERRREYARRRLAEERVERARELEQDQFFGAALKEYEAAAAVLADRPELADRVARMRTEVEVQDMIRRGELAVLRGDFPAGRKHLEQAYERSQASRAEIADLLLVAKEREFEDRYLRAKDLELEHEYTAALEAFRKIDAEWPGYQDVRARISGIESALQLAGDSFAKGKAAEDAGDLPAAIQHYKDALLYVPGYQDLDAKIRELSAKLQP
jgi:tetratricopeptide (TPR) repeat protein